MQHSNIPFQRPKLKKKNNKFSMTLKYGMSHFDKNLAIKLDPRPKELCITSLQIDSILASYYIEQNWKVLFILLLVVKAFYKHSKRQPMQANLRSKNRKILFLTMFSYALIRYVLSVSPLTVAWSSSAGICSSANASKRSLFKQYLLF